MADYRDHRIGINDAARLLGVRSSELRVAVEQETTLRGVDPPRPMYKTGSGGWVFNAGEVMDVADTLGRGSSR